VAIRSLTGATALAFTTAKKAKPIPGINAKMLLLGKRHPKKVAV
jgi:hypothetical protein